jgi:hypothetical protein
LVKSSALRISQGCDETSVLLLPRGVILEKLWTFSRFISHKVGKIDYLPCKVVGGIHEILPMNNSMEPTP